MKTAKLTERAELLLESVRRGYLVFYFTDKPVGWVHLERAGLAARDAKNNLAAVLTPAGAEFLAARPEIVAKFDAR